VTSEMRWPRAEMNTEPTSLMGPKVSIEIGKNGESGKFQCIWLLLANVRRRYNIIIIILSLLLLLNVFVNAPCRRLAV